MSSYSHETEVFFVFDDATSASDPKIGIVEGHWFVEITAVVGGSGTHEPEDVVSFERFEVTLLDEQGENILRMDLSDATHFANQRRWMRSLYLDSAVSVEDALIEAAREEGLVNQAEVDFYERGDD